MVAIQRNLVPNRRYSLQSQPSADSVSVSDAKDRLGLTRYSLSRNGSISSGIHIPHPLGNGSVAHTRNVLIDVPCHSPFRKGTYGLEDVSNPVFCSFYEVFYIIFDSLVFLFDPMAVFSNRFGGVAN